MNFSHGSSKLIEKNEFQLFDYVIDKNNNCNVDHINNGVDGEGAGIYAFIGNSEQSVNDAKLYEHEGYVYQLSIHMEKEELMNLRDNDEIPIEDWVEGIDEFVQEIHRLNGYSMDDFMDIIINSEGLSIQDINFQLQERDIKTEIPSYIDPEELDFYSFQDECRCFYEGEDPCSHIIEEGINNIVEHAIESSDHLYETLYNIWQRTAIFQDQEGISTYNKSFQEAMLRTVARNHNITAAYVDNDNFALIFDTSEIHVDDIIDIENEHKESLKLNNYLNEKTGNKKIKKRSLK